MKKYIFILIIALFFISCSSRTINLNDYNNELNTKLQMHDECKKYYDKEKIKVAVVSFTNNSNFAVANSNDQYSDSGIGIGVSIIGIGARSKSNSSKTTRLVDPKLAKAFIPSIENIIINTSGAELFTRSDMHKIDAELKLQDSGLLEETSIVEFGKISGVRYIITGSIDYVDHNYKNYSNITRKVTNVAMHTNDDDLKLASVAVHLASSFFDGTTIKTAITVKMIDVQSGKIIFSKQVKNESKINSNSKPTYGQLVGAVKKNINEVLPKLKNKFEEKFQANAYINRLKEFDGDIIAQINMGTNDNIKEGNTFVVYNTQTHTDPLSNDKVCEKVSNNIELEASKYISATHTWLKVINGEQKNLKLLQLINRK